MSLGRWSARLLGRSCVLPQDVAYLDLLETEADKYLAAGVQQAG